MNAASILRHIEVEEEEKFHMKQRPLRPNPMEKFAWKMQFPLLQLLFTVSFVEVSYRKKSVSSLDSGSKINNEQRCVTQ